MRVHANRSIRQLPSIFIFQKCTASSHTQTPVFSEVSLYTSQPSFRYIYLV